ncbi:MAG TPA: response regulator [Thermomicrobiales bacterium]|nr:response regulator [Thermomicrobiales bacterium]
MAERTIAVINDDTEFLRLMRLLLTQHGYQVTLHPTADAAYRALRAAPPDLMILDIRMETPEAGWQLLELLRLDPATAALPVLVCSADVVFLQAKEAHLRAEGYAVLEKPFGLTALLERIAALLPSPPAS